MTRSDTLAPPLMPDDKDTQRMAVPPVDVPSDDEVDGSAAPRKRFDFRTDPAAEPNDTIKIIRDGLVNAHAQRARREEAARLVPQELPGDAASTPDPGAVVQERPLRVHRTNVYAPRMLALLVASGVAVGLFIGVVLALKHTPAQTAATLPSSIQLAAFASAPHALPSASTPLTSPAVSAVPAPSAHTLPAPTVSVAPTAPPIRLTSPAVTAPKPSATTAAPPPTSTGPSPIKDELPPGLSP